MTGRDVAALAAGIVGVLLFGVGVTVALVTGNLELLGELLLGSVALMLLLLGVIVWNER